MKKYGFSTLFILGLGALCWFGLPWWSLAATGAASGLLFKIKPGAAFALGFAAGTLLWGTLAGWQNALNAGKLAAQIGGVFQGLTAAQLIWATGALGGLLAGMGALTGALLLGIREKN
ncbi:MAG: hypothetical protein ACK4Q5_19365 [Saprospiraceae bacterium]